MTANNATAQYIDHNNSQFSQMVTSFSRRNLRKSAFAVAYALLLAQFALDYADGKLARTIGGGVLGGYLDSFSDFMAVAAAVVFG